MALSADQIKEEVAALCVLPGITRAGVCLPDRTSITLPEETEAADRFITRTVWDIFKLLELQKIEAQRCLWHYENGQVFGLLAKDQLAVLVIVQGVLAEETAAEVTRAFERMLQQMES